MVITYNPLYMWSLPIVADPKVVEPDPLTLLLPVMIVFPIPSPINIMLLCLISMYSL
ncbi:hypothetical protein Hanom_Chr04g00287801 [Helianthus anomalus]